MPKKILILAANPIGTARLRLDEEVREITEGLRRAGRRDEFIVEQRWAIRQADVRRAMLEVEPNIVHFCGHGKGEEGLAFEDDTGNIKLVNAEALEGFFKLFADTVECVVLNACYSEIQADAISKHINYVVGIEGAIKDTAAIQFAVAFYDALGAGRNYDFAYMLAQNAGKWESVPKDLTPTLRSKIVREATQTIARQQKIDFPDTPASEYISQQVSIELPVVRFPRDLEDFAGRVAPAEWKILPQDDRYFLTNLATKLEPIIQISPPPPIPFVLGFELLALGPNGENFPAVIKRTGFNPALVRLMLTLVALKTADTLRADATFGGQPGARNLLFTVNLDPVMLESPHLRTFLDAYANLLHNVVFEINEDIPISSIDQLKDLVLKYNLRIALDDLNAMSPQMRQALANRAEFTKVDFKIFDEAIKNVWDDPNSVVNKISPFRIEGKSLVVEGLKDETQQRVLAEQWTQNKLGQLYGQGLNLSPAQPWDAWLADLKNYGLLGGHILSSSLLAKANWIISEFLGHEHKFGLERENRGNIFIFKLPGACVGRKNPLILGLLTDLKPDTPVQVEKLDEINCLIVKESTRRINPEPITIDQLPGHLSAWKQVPHLGKQAIEDKWAKDYPEEKHIPPEIEITDNSVISCPATGSPEEGRALLFHWLKPETNVPFCALLGDYGMGKTFLCRMFVRSLLERKREEPNLPVPLYLDMRDLPTWQDGHIPELKEMLKAMTDKAGFSDISIDGILSAVHQGHVLLIFDGFDEKAAHLTDAQSSELLRNIRQAVPVGTKGRLLLSCRTHYFFDRPDERSKVSGGAAVRTRDGYSQTDFLFVYLKPFDEKRILLYLENVLPGKGQEAFKFLKGVHDLTNLAQRPYLLSLITAHLTEIKKLADAGERIGAADVYKTVVRGWMSRDRGKHLLRPHLKVKFMEELAYRMWAEARPEIHFEELYDWLQQQMRDKMPAVALEEDERADADLRTATFISRDPEGNYRFAHRSFFEFFLARYIARQLSQRDSTGAQGATSLSLPRLSREILEFTVDLVHHPSFNLVKAQQLITNILESPYRPQTSENALLMKTIWDRLRPKSSPAPTTFHLEGAELSGADLSGVCLTSVYLTGANLEQANLTDAHLSGNLCQTNLVRAKACGVNLTGNSMSGARLDAADFSGANLSGCNLKDASGTSIFFQRADFTDALLQNASFPYIRLAKAKISEGQIHQADLFCASMPQVAIDRLTLVPQIGHANSVNSVSFSPDGNLLASGSWDNTVRLWDVAAKKELACLTGHSNSVRSVSFSLDGKLLASGSWDKTVRLWDVATRKLICTLLSFGEGRWVSYTPENIFVASDLAMEFIWFCDGLVVYPAEEFAEEFRRPTNIAQPTYTC